MISFSNFKMPHLSILFTGLIALALQIQIDLFATDTYLGLRVNLADLLLPFAGTVVIITLLFQKSIWPKWVFSYAWLWIAGLITVMSISLWHGYETNGFWSNWAFINKYAGFFILMAYFALGAWITSNFEGVYDIHKTFSNMLSVGFVATIIIGLFAVFAMFLFNTEIDLAKFPWEGFMANRNALMVLGIFAMILLETYTSYGTPLYRKGHWLYWFLMPTFFIYNASRTHWIFTGLFSIFVGIKNHRHLLTFIIPALLIGTIFITIIINTISVGEVRYMRQAKYLGAVLSNDVTYQGDQKRFIALEDGLELYQKSNPVLGAGLGVYQEFQKEKRGEYIDVIDFTPLWLLVETGPLGLLTFSAFFFMCLYTLYKTGIKEKQPFQAAVFYFLILIIGMSFLHELLYTRFLWFALGLALARSK